MHPMAEQDERAIKEEIAELEFRLQQTRARLTDHSETRSKSVLEPLKYLHSLLLLSDSALPLGSFAYSAGLESYLAHKGKDAYGAKRFLDFLSHSLASVTSTTIPYVVAGHTEPWRLEEFDNDLDASTTCTVVRRASVKQGLALAAIWERSFRHQFRPHSPRVAESARECLELFIERLKATNRLHDASIFDMQTERVNGHMAPLFGTFCATLTIPLSDTLHLYLLNHVKTLLSAGVRASVLGPYQAQSILASEDLTNHVWHVADEFNARHFKQNTVAGCAIPMRIENAGQSVPCIDLWSGRHELLYSRIFNS